MDKQAIRWTFGFTFLLWGILGVPATAMDYDEVTAAERLQMSDARAFLGMDRDLEQRERQDAELPKRAKSQKVLRTKQSAVRYIGSSGRFLETIEWFVEEPMDK